MYTKKFQPLAFDQLRKHMLVAQRPEVIYSEKLYELSQSLTVHEGSP